MLLYSRCFFCYIQLAKQSQNTNYITLIKGTVDICKIPISTVRSWKQMLTQC
ncbi:hypothetical protein RHMOL_Rhmol02G0259800 [Rhododendron molle]|uniref:Uncharacterized protein n=1 Tax=Rhododendron molle TaxID=49168 RepID=A0ACC0PVK8_RHOML|nr:hypothetical protein RHMOL_Rhmol02G0259800 [Rhododendron molle]